MIDKITSYMEDATKRYDITNMKINAYMESVLTQYEINCKKSELKILQESGTDEDLYFLQENAAENAVEGIKKAVDKIVETFKKFISEIKVKIMSLIASKETNEALDGIEKKVKFNPFLSKKKVKIEDTKKQLKVIEWAQSEIQKLISKIKGGKEVTTEDVSKVKDEFDKKLKVAAGIGAALTVTVGAAIVYLKKSGKSMNDEIEKAKKVGLDLVESAKSVIGGMHVKYNSVIQMISSAATGFGKAAAEVVVSGWKTALQAVRSAVSKVKGAASNVENSGLPAMKESTGDDLIDSLINEFDESGSLFDESDATDLLNDIENQLFGESEDDDSDLDDFISMFETDVLS